MSQKIRLVSLVVLVLIAITAIPLTARAASNWAPNTSYSLGAQVIYNGTIYECITAHTSQTGWEPAIVPALWKVVSTTATATNNVAATATKTPTKTATPAATATQNIVPTATAVSNCQYATWSSTATYVLDNYVVLNSRKWRAKWWNQNDQPDVSTSGAWESAGNCTTSSPSATPTNGPVATLVPGNPFPARVFAAYADISFTSIQSSYSSTAQKYYAIAFVLGKDHTCVPAWDGTHPMPENFYASQINAIRAGGGDVIAVFGGANGAELGSVCSSVSELQAAYQAVINQYQIKWIDLNIEGGLIGDTASIDRRNKAIRALQVANPSLLVSYTMPVMQTGLLQTALDLLTNAKNNSVRVDFVNIMTMNYGPSGIDMGQASIDSAVSTRNQLVSMGLSSTKIGITPMNGQNNTLGEIFTLADADQLVAFAKANSYVGWLSFWSLGRDNGGCAGQTAASASCSGITQNAYDFTRKFQLFP